MYQEGCTRVAHGFRFWLDRTEGRAVGCVLQASTHELSGSPESKDRMQSAAESFHRLLVGLRWLRSFCSHNTLICELLVLRWARRQSIWLVCLKQPAKVLGSRQNIVTGKGTNSVGSFCMPRTEHPHAGN